MCFLKSLPGLDEQENEEAKESEFEHSLGTSFTSGLRCSEQDNTGEIGHLFPFDFFLTLKAIIRQRDEPDRHANQVILLSIPLIVIMDYDISFEKSTPCSTI